jgi:hypothetical protein
MIGYTCMIPFRVHAVLTIRNLETGLPVYSTPYDTAGVILSLVMNLCTTQLDIVPL